MPDKLANTADDKPFLFFNDTVIENDLSPVPKRLLIFMSLIGREMLANSTTWYVDGTFKSASHTLFTQIMMILVKSGTGKVDPALYALVPDKEKRTYRYLIRKFIYFKLA